MLPHAFAKHPCDFILFGALGDLSCRKLIPALYQLDRAQLLHPQTRIIGCSREALSTTDFGGLINDKLQKHIGPILDETIWTRFLARMTYCQIDVTNPADFQQLTTYTAPDKRTPISYFAISPSLYHAACLGLSSVDLVNQPSRVVIEKPIGEDLASSQQINNTVAQFFAENQVYRIDHYLGKETVMNLLVLRFANSLFSSNWDHRFIEKVEITLAEEIGVEGRWDYYDKAGQIRDMVQNHVLQILALVAMDPPLSLAAENIRSEKLKVLKSLRLINEDNVNESTVRAQYTQTPNKPGYLDEEGANKASQTETFVAIKAFIDNWRWSGVPFHLLTGKCLSKKQSEVVIYFKQQPHNLFKHVKQELPPNQLVIRLQPDEGVELHIVNKVPGLGDQTNLYDSILDLNFNNSIDTPRIADAYERLLLEIMQGNQSLFVSREEIEQAWIWIDSIRESWDKSDTPLEVYEPGSWGPTTVHRLFSGQTHLWSALYATV